MMIGETAQDFSLIGVDDKTYTLDSFKDADVLVVVFSCNHCPYVKAYEDRMVLYHEELMGKGVKFVAINANDEVNYPQDNLDRMKERAEEKNFSFPYLRDESQDIARAYGAKVTPHFFVFDKERKLVYKGSMDDNLDDADAVKEFYVKDAINAALEGKDPAVAETEPVGCSVKWK